MDDGSVIGWLALTIVTLGLFFDLLVGLPARTRDRGRQRRVPVCGWGSGLSARRYETPPQGTVVAASQRPARDRGWR